MNSGSDFDDNSDNEDAASPSGYALQATEDTPENRALIEERANRAKRREENKNKPLTHITVGETNYEITPENLKNPLGKGNFGAVYLVTHPTTTIQYAVKVSLEPTEDSTPEFEIHQKFAEKIGDKCLASPMMGEDNRGNQCIIVEYCNGGSLDKYLEKIGALPMEAEQRSNLLSNIQTQLDEIGQAVDQTDYLHRDIACRNILVKENTDQNGNISIKLVLADFGRAVDLNGDAEYKLINNERCPWLTSPRETYVYGVFTKETDKFAMEITKLEAEVLIYGGNIRDLLGFSNKSEIQALKIDENGDAKVLELLSNNATNFVNSKKVELANTLNETIADTTYSTPNPNHSRINTLRDRLNDFKIEHIPTNDDAIINKGIDSIEKNLKRLESENISPTQFEESISRTEKLFNSLSSLQEKAIAQSQRSSNNNNPNDEIYNTPTQPTIKR